jgi:hypothetical protein
VTEPKSKGELTLSTVTEALGALAAVAGLIFVTGGAVLALRLAFEDLPALGVVGQLPNGFLFSIGVTQVVIPALAVAALHIIYVAHRNTPPGERPSVWDTARMYQRSRWRHLIAASVLPVALVLPGAVLALWHNEHRALASLVAVAAVIAVVCGIVLYRRAARSVPEGEAVTEAIFEQDTRGFPRHNFAVLSGMIVFLAIGVAVDVFGDGSWQFLWLVAAWAGCVPVVLGYLLLRGKVGDAYREDDQKQHIVRAQAVLSLAVAALAVPGLICFWAAWPLEKATVCTSGATADETPFTVEGVFVGETGDRVYVGDTEAASPSIVSIPQPEVTRTVIGDESTTAADCPTDLTPEPPP